jgi:hypothetical protein
LYLDDRVQARNGRRGLPGTVVTGLLWVGIAEHTRGCLGLLTRRLSDSHWAPGAVLAAMTEPRCAAARAALVGRAQGEVGAAGRVAPRAATAVSWLAAARRAS